MAGMDPVAFLYERDAMKRNVQVAVARAVIEWQKQRDDNLAINIANQVGKLFPK